MQSGPRLRLVAVAGIVLLAGCAMAPVTDSDEAAPSSDDGFVSLENHSLDIDGDLVFDRVETLVDEDVRQPPVNVQEASELPQSTTAAASQYPYMHSEFVEHLDLLNRSDDAGSPAGLTNGFGNVYLVNGTGTPVEMEQVLAHEYVHSIQFRASILPWQTTLDGEATTDAFQTRLALTEGGAVYVADEYTREHLSGTNVSLQSEQIAESFTAARAGERLLFAPYYFGPDYFEHQLDSPQQFRTVFENPPNTTAHILHNRSADETVTLPLDTALDGGESWDATNPDTPNTLGEITTRVALTRVLDRDRAASAATGWANDSVYAFESSDGEYGFAWAFRFTDAENATEFQQAFEQYGDGRSTDSDLTFKTTNVSDQTVVVFSGPPAFVDNAAATGTDEDVTVEIGNSDGVTTVESRLKTDIRPVTAETAAASPGPVAG